MFPENLLTACFQQVETVFRQISKNITVAPMEYKDGEVTIANDSQIVSYFDTKQVYKDGTNVLGKQSFQSLKECQRNLKYKR